MLLHDCIPTLTPVLPTHSHQRASHRHFVNHAQSKTRRKVHLRRQSPPLFHATSPGKASSPEKCPATGHSAPRYVNIRPRRPSGPLSNDKVPASSGQLYDPPSQISRAEPRAAPSGFNQSPGRRPELSTHGIPGIARPPGPALIPRRGRAPALAQRKAEGAASRFRKKSSPRTARVARFVPTESLATGTGLQRGPPGLDAARGRATGLSAGGTGFPAPR